MTLHTIVRFPQCGSAHPFAIDEHFLASPRESHSRIRAKSQGKSRMEPEHKGRHTLHYYEREAFLFLSLLLNIIKSAS